MKFSLLVALSGSLLSCAAWSRLIGIPTSPYDVVDNREFKLQSLKQIIVDHQFAEHRDESGLTLIPPTLYEFATTFADDLWETFGIEAKVIRGTQQQLNTVFLTLGDKGDYLGAAGRHSSEGYNLATNRSGISITGASPLGVWWGTRTLFQQAVIHDGFIASGTGIDIPGWGTRGMMLDCARHFYPKDFLIDMCSYMSFFKQNTFHLHLSDNIILSSYKSNVFQDIYARFRLWSDNDVVRGLNKHFNESYTRADFDEIQERCAARGVTILPEIESPGHALPIVQWRPELGYTGDMSLLNISHPDTIPTMKTIWQEFLPWFHSKIVSIGADEYSGPKEEYDDFVNIMNTFIRHESGKSVRIWGTFPPQQSDSPNNVISHNVSVQHWTYSYDNPLDDYIKNNYSTLNSDEMYYVVLKCCGYSRSVDTSITFSGNPANHGPWYPNIFSLNNASDNAAHIEPLVQGAIAPLWNDRGANTSVYSEAFYAWRDGIPALADKQWGGNLTKDEFLDIFPKLSQHIPAQNLERRIPSKESTIFRYDFSHQTAGTVKDLSSNAYDAETSCKAYQSSLKITPTCALTTPLESKGRNYTLSLSLKVDKLTNPTNTTLTTGRDSVLLLTPNITLFSAGNYYRLNSTIPLKTWVTLKILARGQQTFASVTSKSGKSLVEEEEFIAKIGVNNEGFSYAPMAIEAPIHQVSGWTGELNGLNLTNEA